MPPEQQMRVSPHTVEWNGVERLGADKEMVDDDGDTQYGTKVPWLTPSPIQTGRLLI